MSGQHFCLTCSNKDTSYPFLCENAGTECPQCREMVLITNMEQHYRENHAPRLCTDCYEVVENSFLEQHKRNLCHRFRQICTYCGADLPTCLMPLHTEHCDMRKKLQRIRVLSDQAQPGAGGSRSDYAEPQENANNRATVIVHTGSTAIIDPDSNDDDGIIVEQRCMEIIDLVSDSDDDVNIIAEYDCQPW